MEWLKINSIEDLKKDGSVFLTKWDGDISLCQWSEWDGLFFIAHNPSTMYFPRVLDTEEAIKELTEWIPLKEEQE